MLFLARHASENASRAPVSCPQSVESAVLRAFENAFNVAGAVPRAFENASRAPGALLRYRASIRYTRSLFFAPNFPSVQEKPVFCTECLFCRPLSLEYPFHAEARTRSESLAGAEIV